MSIYRGPYFGASRCNSATRPGTDALVSWYLGAYRARGAANLGTYVCKRLGSGWSIHAVRRAADLGTNPYGGVDSAWGWALANALRLNSAELGIQLIILGRRVWSCTHPDAGWRLYGGEWHGHMHVELTPSASISLTPSKIQTQLHPSTDWLTMATEAQVRAIVRAEIERAAAPDTGVIPEGVWARQQPTESKTAGHKKTYADMVRGRNARFDALRNAVIGILQAAGNDRDNQTVMALINQIGEEGRAERAQMAAALTQISQLVAKVGTGELTAEQVVDEIGRRTAPTT